MRETKPLSIPDNPAFDTVKTKPYPITAKPAIFETAFFPGTNVSIDSIATKMYAADIGKISIESGKIIACDPIVMHDATAFTEHFPIGRFPVQLAIAKFNNDERVAFSRILFSDNPVIKWEFALLKGQQPIPTTGDAFYSYGVDGGIGLFIDEASRNTFQALSRKHSNTWKEVFIDQMSKNYRNTWEYLLYSFGKSNFAAFSTGYGDGSYATYIGYDEDGKVCRLLTDFGWQPGGNEPPYIL